MPSVLINDFPAKGSSTRLENTRDLVKFLEKIPQEDRMQWVIIPEITALIQSNDIYGTTVYTVKWKTKGEEKKLNTIYLQLKEGDICCEMRDSPLRSVKLNNGPANANRAHIDTLVGASPTLFHQSGQEINSGLIHVILEQTYNQKMTSLHGTRLCDIAALLKLLPEEVWQAVVGLYRPSASKIASWTIDEQVTVLRYLFADSTNVATLPVLTPDKFSTKLQHLGIDQVSKELAIVWCKPLKNSLFQLLTNMFPLDTSHEILSAVLLGNLNFLSYNGTIIPDDIFKRCIPTLEDLGVFLSQLTRKENNVFIAQQYFKLAASSTSNISESCAALANYLTVNAGNINEELQSDIIIGYIKTVVSELKTKDQCDTFRKLMQPLVAHIDVKSYLMHIEVPDTYNSYTESAIKTEHISMLMLSI